jgi:hypothetical protein
MCIRLALTKSLESISPEDLVKEFSFFLSDYEAEKVCQSCWKECNGCIFYVASSEVFFFLMQAEKYVQLKPIVLELCSPHNADRLKGVSNSITCLTSSQYERVTTFLLSKFCKRGSMKV